MSSCFTYLNYISYVLENNYFAAFFFSKLCGVLAVAVMVWFLIIFSNLPFSYYYFFLLITCSL